MILKTKSTILLWFIIFSLIIIIISAFYWICYAIFLIIFTRYNFYIFSDINRSEFDKLSLIKFITNLSYLNKKKITIFLEIDENQLEFDNRFYDDIIKCPNDDIKNDLCNQLFKIIIWNLNLKEKVKFISLISYSYKFENKWISILKELIIVIYFNNDENLRKTINKFIIYINYMFKIENNFLKIKYDLLDLIILHEILLIIQNENLNTDESKITKIPEENNPISINGFFNNENFFINKKYFKSFERIFLIDQKEQKYKYTLRDTIKRYKRESIIFNKNNYFVNSFINFKIINKYDFSMDNILKKSKYDFFEYFLSLEEKDQLEILKELEENQKIINHIFYSVNDLFNDVKIRNLLIDKFNFIFYNIKEFLLEFENLGSGKSEFYEIIEWGKKANEEFKIKKTYFDYIINFYPILLSKTIDLNIKFEFLNNINQIQFHKEKILINFKNKIIEKAYHINYVSKILNLNEDNDNYKELILNFKKTLDKKSYFIFSDLDPNKLPDRNLKCFNMISIFPIFYDFNFINDKNNILEIQKKFEPTIDLLYKETKKYQDKIIIDKVIFSETQIFVYIENYYSKNDFLIEENMKKINFEKNSIENNIMIFTGIYSE